MLELILASNVVQDRPDMNESHYEGAIAYEETQDKIYIIGGKETNSCEYYDVKQNQWVIFSKLDQ